MTDKHELDINEEILEADIVEDEESVDEAIDDVVEESVEDAEEEIAEDSEVIDEDSEEEIEEETEESSEETEGEVSEDSEEPVEEKTVQEEIISEFAPAPIKIPNYNKEREKKKVQKAKAKNKKAKSKKARRRKRIIRKTLTTIRNIFLFLFILIVATATVASLLVRMNTTDSSVEKAIRDAGPETFVIGKIENPDELGLEESSPSARVADIVRDNIGNGVTYKGIEGAVESSAYPKFVSKVTTNVINYYVFGGSYKAVTEEEIKDMLVDCNGRIGGGGNLLGPTRSEEIAERIAKSPAAQSISKAELDKQEASKYTSLTSVLFSSSVLTFLVIALLLLLILTIIYCRTYWHNIIGSAVIIAGLVVGVLGFLFKPAFITAVPFVRSVIDAITKSFNDSALIYGAVTILIGALIVFIGKSMRDDDDDYYYEEEPVKKSKK